MNKYLSLFLLSFMLAYAQSSGREEQQNFLSNKSLNDTKILNRYYSSVFKEKVKEKESNFPTQFQLNRENILEKLKEGIPLDGPVLDSEYLIGPGDVIQINIWGDVSLEFPVIVTPESKIIISNFGIYDLMDKTLLESAEYLKREIGKNLKNSEISITLLAPRIFTVNVSGVVLNPGSHYASSVQRIDHVIYLANLQATFQNPTNSQFQSSELDKIKNLESIQYFRDNEINKTTLEPSLRNVKVIRKNGDTLNVDLVRFYATGDTKYNPYLNDGDRIIVPNLDDKYNSILISGAVKLEGEYEYSNADSSRNIFDVCQGLKSIADSNSIDFYRWNRNNKEYIHKKYTFKEMIDLNFKLNPNDQIVVREVYPREKSRTVLIKGEVKWPGLYPIIKGKTKLSEIIDLAGGFTDKASMQMSKIIRYPINLDITENNPDYYRLALMRLSEMDPLQIEYYNYENAIKREFVSSNFVDLFINGEKKSDILLVDGDVILIPEKTNTISIIGQVPFPGYLEYNKSYNYKDYIRIAGGLTEYADEDEIMIIKSNSNQWLDSDDTQVEVGDIIWVPKTKYRDFGYYFFWISNIISAAGGVATILLLLTK